ncbi:hypothetical protein TSOC_014978, partial [Tetrabaena socialis]
AGADVNAKNVAGETSGDAASKNGHKDVVELLEAALKEAAIRPVLEGIRGVPCRPYGSVCRPPMRLLKIDAVLAWTTIKVYEEVGVQSQECMDVPYGDVTEEQWAQTLVVSWRWGTSKPVQLQPSFSPMSESQFRELTQVLQRAMGCGLQYVWIDWSCVPQYSVPSMVEVLRSKVRRRGG